MDKISEDKACCGDDTERGELFDTSEPEWIPEVVIDLEVRES